MKDGKQTNSNLELPREEVFENNITKLFTKNYFAVLTTKVVVLKEFRECILQDDEGRLKDVNHNLHLYWLDLHALSGCVYPDERVALQNSFQEAVLESLHLIHPGSWGMIFLS